jgi:hypothetical protein
MSSKYREKIDAQKEEIGGVYKIADFEGSAKERVHTIDRLEQLKCLSGRSTCCTSATPSVSSSST